jgi:hypothetical protein
MDPRGVKFVYLQPATIHPQPARLLDRVRAALRARH